MSSFGQQLPVTSVIQPLMDATLSGNDVILQAAPGAGKSTVVPLALLEQGFDGKVLLMQPRRVVVRSLAQFLASQLGENVGETVGYRIKGETKTSAKTRLEVITEGVLARMIQSDPELNGVSLIIFDEFHERSIHSDYGLALAIEVQQGLREDLRLLVMSATFNVEEVASLLPDATCLHSEGRQFPIETIYVGNIKHDDIVEQSVRCVIRALDQHEGDILVFLPGARWINQALNKLEARVSDSDVILVPLFGALSQAEQQQAIAPAPLSKRKVILSTNIAETSLTLPGITVVVDSGREQQARFHAASGLTQLSLQMISQASSIQRQGRAGRVQAGHCYRLWGKDNQSRLAKDITPQILAQDVTGVTLDALAWGTKLTEMAMLTQPSRAQSRFSQTTLFDIGAIDKNGQILARGQKLAAFPIAPQYGAGLMDSTNYAEQYDAPNILAAACFLIAWVEEGIGRQDSGNILDQWRELSGPKKKQWLKQSARLWSLVRPSSPMPEPEGSNDDSIAIAAILCFPSRIAKRRGSGRYTMASGSGAQLRQETGKPIDWLVVLSGQNKDSEVVISQAIPFEYALFERVMGAQFKRETIVHFDKDAQRMRSEDALTFKQLILERSPSQRKAKDKIAAAWVDYLEQLDFKQWPLEESDWQWLKKIELARCISLRQPAAYDGDDPWPQPNQNWLLDGIIEHYQAPLSRCTSLADLAKLNWTELFTQMLTWPQQDAIKQFLPSSLAVPSGNQRKLDYLDNGKVKLSVRMQEMYGLAAPIYVAEGKVIVTVELLNPAGRPIQTTQDLGGFWSGSYADVKKEMKGRYPKHYWPDDPTSAQATTKTKKAMG